MEIRESSGASTVGPSGLDSLVAVELQLCTQRLAQQQPLSDGLGGQVDSQGGWRNSAGRARRHFNMT